MSDEEYITVSQAMFLHTYTRQAIYQAIKTGKLRSTTSRGVLVTTKKWLDEYVEKAQYRANDVIRNGKKLFDENRGTYTVKQAAEILCMNYSCLFNEIYHGNFHAPKEGGNGRRVVTRAEIIRFAEERKKRRFADPDAAEMYS